ncbi:MAG: DUF6326 family protein, partial [Gaiellaceae bacterium]
TCTLGGLDDVIRAAQASRVARPSPGVGWFFYLSTAAGSACWASAGSGARMDMKSKISLFWIFYMFNATYIDITTLYYSVFINHKPKVHYTQVFLLGAAVLIEISIVMIVLSRLLEYRANRRANIGAGIFLTVIQFVTLFVGTPTLAYAFLSIILIGTSGVIAWWAWRWSEAEVPAHAIVQPGVAGALEG